LSGPGPRLIANVGISLRNRSPLDSGEGQERNEVAPFHFPMLPCFRPKGIAYLGTAALRDLKPAYDRKGSCVTSIADPNGGAQLYER
jgi:hypothetical protein